ncbi:shikimate dehydrogenase family protein [Kaistella antarctica]|uniref:Shikimate dehydrogenase n=1 Tax=Kaistella antarctica TaxID=266748 RepID=A0A448NQ95_9FLAO|nr:shikimate dehydrogenase [Kaistella antarctica]KEY19225.1 shikimate dehydrogenase [Kaistella antarctica]SEW04297.1 shikimate dehydrogenase [Kaistella antarctica]VEH98667.1 Shikimate dehydrogenase [Kaistella antarctica]
MDQQIKLGLIGKNISYSFSKNYFENKFKKLFLKNHTYEVFDLNDIADVEQVFNNQNLTGLNVTIPFKEKIIPYLDELSNEAEKIGAVNTILIKDDIKKGFNTDAFGFEKTLLLHQKDIHQSALILGNGGAAKAVKYVLEKHDIPYQIVSRTGDLNFENLTKEMVADNLLIIQCTPVGTFPNVEDSLDFPFSDLTSKHLIIDLIYNPEYTSFIKMAAQNGSKTVNGFYMLEQQAEKAWEIWNVQKK